MKDDVLRVFEELFEKGIINNITNKTYISLIPKKEELKKISDFRSISLVTSLYKMIAKVLSLQLKEVLPFTIDEHRSDFIVGRQILDSAPIANKVVEKFMVQHKGLVFKIDYAKAYDHVEWNSWILY